MIKRAMDPVLMEMLVCLAEERSFTAAAERMHLTQQAVSAQVKRLEALTGHRMVVRSRQEVKLTQAGETLLVYARQTMAMAEQIRRKFAVVPLEGTIRLGFTPAFEIPRLFPILTEVKHRFPRLELYCETARTENLTEKLDAGELDLVIGAQLEGERRGKVLLREKLVWTGHTEQLLLPGQPIPLVSLVGPSFLRDHVFKLLERAGLDWTVFFESDDNIALRAAVQSGWGIALFNRNIVMDGDSPLPEATEGVLPEAGYVEFFLRHQDPSGIVGSFAQILQEVLSNP